MKGGSRGCEGCEEENGESGSDDGGGGGHPWSAAVAIDGDVSRGRGVYFVVFFFLPAHKCFAGVCAFSVGIGLRCVDLIIGFYSEKFALRCLRNDVRLWFAPFSDMGSLGC